MTNPLYAWLKARKYWVSDPGDHRTITHFFMDGGKCHVPDDAVEEFFTIYCDALAKGVKQYVVEARTPLFKLFMDLDIQSKAPIPDDLLSRICKCVHACSREFFDPMDSNFIICNCPERVLPESGHYKRGVHLHWTNVFVSSSKAMVFRNTVLMKCVETFGECFAVPWANILDQTVFKSSGLRIIGSSKKDAPGEYYPSLMITKDNNLITVENPVNNLQEWVLATTIRTTTQRSIDTTDHGGEEKILKSEYKGDFSHLNVKEHSDLVDAVSKVIATVKDKTGQPFFKKMRVTSLYKIKEGSHLTYIIGTTCKNCLNKVGDSGLHRSNHVYFVANDAGVFQKCFCRCETTEGRKYMMCRDFKFRLSEGLPDQVYKTLFGKDKPQRSSDMLTAKDPLKQQLDRIMMRMK